MYVALTKCLVCGRDTEQILSLGEQPLANSYHLEDEILPSYPLTLRLCKICFHAQLGEAVAPDLLYKNYLYTSGTSKTLRDYFDTFVKRASDHAIEHGDDQKSRVLEIASNDGTLLGKFAEAGWETLGVDPAENLQVEASKKSKTICGYWDGSTAAQVGDQWDIIVAMNVLAHVSNPLSFLKACKMSMNKNTSLYIQTSQCKMFERGEFDTIYHEHHSFFSVLSMMQLALRAGLRVADVTIEPVHGDSYLFRLDRGNPDMVGRSVMNLQQSEMLAGRYNDWSYTTFASGVKLSLSTCRATLGFLTDQGRTIVGYGAAAKGNTFLNAGKIELDWIVDDNPLKVGLLTPGMDIQIRPVSSLVDVKNLAVVVLAWNFWDETVSKVKALRHNPDDIFIRFFPQLKVQHG